MKAMKAITVAEAIRQLQQQNPDNKLLLDTGEEFIDVVGFEGSDPSGMVMVKVQQGA